MGAKQPQPNPNPSSKGAVPPPPPPKKFDTLVVQHRSLVYAGVDCPGTNSGQHHVEVDTDNEGRCRHCGLKFTFTELRKTSDGKLVPKSDVRRGTK